MAAADASECGDPVHVPSRTVADLLPGTSLGWRGIRASWRSRKRPVSLTVRETLNACPGVHSASATSTAIDLMSVGARGVIRVGQRSPRGNARGCQAALAGDFVKAARSTPALQPLHKDLFVEASPIPVKWAVARMGHRNAIRYHLVETVGDAPRYRAAAMQAAGINLEDQAA